MVCRGEMSMILGLLCLVVVFSSQRIQSRRLFSSEEEETDYLRKQLKILNKPHVKSIKDNYGNMFDCVDIYKQPAFDHPLLKNHTIQMPSISFVEKISSKPSQKEKLISFGFNESCPTGTVLIRRTSLDDLIRDRNYAPHFHTEDNTPAKLHRVMFIAPDIKTYGARAEMEVFELPSLSINQASLAQVILTKGERGPLNNYNAIHFGWRSIQQDTGDKRSHFFTYWTSDGYQKTGCYDMGCPGFVQLSKSTTPGMVLPGRSAIKLNAYRDPYIGNWVLVREDKGKEIIGYWPKAIFNNMADCSQVQMGGSAYSPLDEPSPPMGNGFLPGLEGYAARFRHVELMSGNGQSETPTKYNFFYDINLSEFYYAGYPENFATGLVFQYGGPGGFKK